MANIPDMNLTELNAKDMKKVYMILLLNLFRKYLTLKNPQRSQYTGQCLRRLIKVVEVITIKLNKGNRWGGIKRKLLENGVNVNFTEGDSNYITAF